MDPQREKHYELAGRIKPPNEDAGQIWVSNELASWSHISPIVLMAATQTDPLGGHGQKMSLAWSVLRAEMQFFVMNIMKTTFLCL